MKRNVSIFCGPVGLLVQLLLGACGDEPAEGQGLGEACGSRFDLDHDGAPDAARVQCEGDLAGWALGDLPEAREEYQVDDVNGDHRTTVSCTSWWSAEHLNAVQPEDGWTWGEPQLSRQLIDGGGYGPQDGLWDWEQTQWYDGTCD